ncbi:MAG: hypothetical protein VYA34_13380 [Myxococcota bacterium]|nr:hypothetical protein [Myxococcota bacterium]
MTAPIAEIADSPNGETHASEQNYFFYNPGGVGAHAFHTPWTIIIESGFEEYDSRSLNKLNLARGQKLLLKSILNPADILDRYGKKKFLYQQILPAAGVTGGPPAYIPNYLWHLLGGGFRFRLMTEYFTHHGSKYPQLFSWLTLYAGHWLNEAVQAQELKHGSADALADLFFFDWVGKVLFLNDSVSEFFSKVLHLRDWSYQTSWNPLTNSLHNTGQLFWARLDLGWGFSLSSLTGHTINSANLTYSMDDNRTQWSIGAGLRASGYEVLENDDLVPRQLRWCFLAAYSENDNPILVIVGKEGLPENTLYDRTVPEPRPLKRDNYTLAPSIQINMYPKWLELWGEKIALHVSWKKDAFFMGFGHSLLPVGLGISTPVHEKYRDDF